MLSALGRHEHSSRPPFYLPRWTTHPIIEVRAARWPGSAVHRSTISSLLLSLILIKGASYDRMVVSPLWRGPRNIRGFMPVGQSCRAGLSITLHCATPKQLQQRESLFLICHIGHGAFRQLVAVRQKNQQLFSACGESLT